MTELMLAKRNISTCEVATQKTLVKKDSVIAIRCCSKYTKSVTND
jgi:hypothetical protein